MDLFQGILPFVHTAEERSFRRAAERLGVTPAAVSKAVAKLEDDLGVRLLNRTSRRVALTPEGALFLERCREAVAHLKAGREAVAEAQRTPKGSLAVTLPFILGRLVVPSLAKLSSRYPALSFRLKLTDRFSKLVDDSIDVAVRIGDLEDSSLVSRRLRRTRWVTLASPAYLARHGAPKTPGDLEDHNCLKFLAPRGKTHEWSFQDGAQSRASVAKTSGNLEIDQGELLLDAAVAGMGLCHVLDFMVTDLVREAKLVEVLSDYAAEGPAIRALCLPGRKSSPKVRALLDFLAEELRRDALDPLAG